MRNNNVNYFILSFLLKVFKPFLLRFIGISFTALTLIACSSSLPDTGTSANQDLVASPQDIVQQVPTISSYWNSIDFQTLDLDRDSARIEQKFVDFLVLLKQDSSATIQPAFSGLLNKAQANPRVFSFLENKIEDYLYHPNSLYYDEEIYSFYLQYIMASSESASIHKQRAKQTLFIIQQNQVGSLINDFQFINQQNVKMRFASIPATLKLVVFYDPTCGHCAAIMEALGDNQILQNLGKAGTLQIVAVCPLDMYDLWRAYQAHIPANWINGFDPQQAILADGKFAMRVFPSMYLVDANNRVLLKDPTQEQLLNFLQTVRI